MWNDCYRAFSPPLALFGRADVPSTECGILKPFGTAFLPDLVSVPATCEGQAQKDILTFTLSVYIGKIGGATNSKIMSQDVNVFLMQ